VAYYAECVQHRHKKGDANFTGSFIDITDHQDAPAWKEKVLKSQLRLGAERTPKRPHHQSFVKSALEKLDVEQFRKDIEHLSTAYHTRYYTQQGSVDSVRWLADQYRAATPASRAGEVSLREIAHSFLQPSLIVRLEGTSKADEVVVLGGHIDSISGRSATNHAPGADDDASGCAAVLSTFRALMESDFKPSRSIEFHVYAAEEVGLRGSQDVAKEFAEKEVKVAGMLQLDMTGWDNGNPRVGVITDYTDAAQNDFIRALTNTYLTIPPADGRCGYGCSDHASFERYGYPSSFAFEAPFGEHSPHIHTARDTLENMNMTHATEFAKLAVAFATELAW